MNNHVMVGVDPAEQAMNNDKLTIAERIRTATIADSSQEGVNIAEGRFGSAMASLCRELDALLAEKMVYGNPRRPQHQGEPIYQVQYLGDGGGGWSDAEKASYDAKVPHPKHWRTRIVYAEQPAPVALDFKYKHPITKECRTVILTKAEVSDGMEDTLYEKLVVQICPCCSVGETNVVDCNCDEYGHDFELVADSSSASQPAPVSEASTEHVSRDYPHGESFYRNKDAD